MPWSVRVLNTLGGTGQREERVSFERMAPRSNVLQDIRKEKLCEGKQHREHQYTVLSRVRARGVVVPCLRSKESLLAESEPESTRAPPTTSILDPSK